MSNYFSKILKELREQKGWSQEDLAQIAQMTKDHISKMERGTQSNPRYETILKLANSFGVNPAVFFPDQDQKQKKSKKGQLYKIKISSSTVPLISLAQAGRSGFFDEAGFPKGHGWNQISVTEDFLKKEPHAYGLRVTGDSMLPALKSGDVVIVSPKGKTQNGDLVVARFKTGEVMIKEFFQKNKNTFLFKSYNPKHDPIITQKKELLFLHKVAMIKPR